MAGDLERSSPNRQPAKLPGSETEASMTLRLHHERPAVATLLTDLRNDIRPAQDKERLEDTDVKQKAHPENEQPDPQSPLPGVAKVETPPDHVNDSRGDGHQSEQDVCEMPGLVADP